jgi:hypothetical protein
MLELGLIVYVAIGLVNVFLIGHRFAGKKIVNGYRSGYGPDEMDGGEVMGLCLIGVVLAPFVLAYELGRRIRNIPKIRISFSVDKSKDKAA